MLVWIASVITVVVFVLAIDYALKRRLRPLSLEKVVDVDEDKSIIPYNIVVDESVVQDLKSRLMRTRYPAPVAFYCSEDDGWAYGTETEFQRELVHHWFRNFDWQKKIAVINSWPHYSTTVDGVRIRFLHFRSERDNAKPLVLVHGWPDTVYSFYKVFESLVSPEDEDAQAFHLVVPSLPGFGFSSMPTKRGWGCQQTARAIVTLMCRLGYDAYGVHGGDWGSIITSYVALLDPEHCMGIHLTMVPVGPPMCGLLQALEVLFTLAMSVTPLRRLFFSVQELRHMKRAKHYISHMSAYFKIQSTKPLTLGYGLNDSPSGLLAWVVEKYRSWCDASEAEAFFTEIISKDDILTTVFIFWITNSITSSMRMYYEFEQGIDRRDWAETTFRVMQPVAVAAFPNELLVCPKRWAEVRYNVQRWTEFEHGGHFAALEKPHEISDDISSFFASLAF